MARQQSLFGDASAAQAKAARPGAAPTGGGSSKSRGAKAKAASKTSSTRKAAGKTSPAGKAAGKPSGAKRASRSGTTTTARSRAKGGARTKAHEMADASREISVSEFFAKNRHLLGFDSKRKALLTTVKEAVDNALDACEEAEILPDIAVTIEAVKNQPDRLRVTVSDNGPGILPEQIDLVFAKLLYGSKFHRLRQSRGQQGIGISAAGMYGQMTTGSPTVIRSRIGKRHDAHEVAVRIDTVKNQPVRARTKVFEWDRAHGTEVSIELEATFKRGRGSVDEYISQTAIANPHVQITYRAPDTKTAEVYERATKKLPKAPKEIKPHPHGVELGMLMKMMKSTGSSKLSGFLQKDFSRVSAAVAQQICKLAKLEGSARVRSLEHKSAEALYKAIPQVRIMNPPTDCLSPIGEELIQKGLQKEIGEAEFFVSRTRAPAVYRGNPFQVEVGVALGGDLPAEDTARLLRFANRVPLQYQPGACAMTKAVTGVDWKAYGLSQPGGSMPIGPVIFMVHIASAWVPFTSESKEAVASYSEITKELRLALQECGRHMQRYLRRRKRIADEMKKRSYIDKYIPAIGEALRDILELNEKQTDNVLVELRDTLERSRTI